MFVFTKGARRIVPEWTDLDSEAQRFTANILGDEPDFEVPAQPLAEPKPEDAKVDSSLEDDLESKSEL